MPFIKDAVGNLELLPFNQKGEFDVRLDRVDIK